MISLQKKITFFLLILLGILFSCIFIFLKSHNKSQLDIFGPTITNSNNQTVYHTIPDFELTNQYNKKINKNIFKNKIYVTDFIFTTCQTICPLMSNQMFRIQEQTKVRQDILLLSHTVNPENDSVSVLHDYAIRLKAREGKWHFVTGDKKKIYDLARTGYFVTAAEGDGGPDDFIHSEKLILVDRKARIRGYYNGTSQDEVNKLLDDIKILLNE